MRKASQDRPAHKARRVLRALQALPEYKVQQVSGVSRVLLDLKVRQAYQVRQAQLARKVRRQRRAVRAEEALAEMRANVAIPIRVLSMRSSLEGKCWHDLLRPRSMTA